MTKYSHYDYGNKTLNDAYALQDLREHIGEDAWTALTTQFNAPWAQIPYTDKKNWISYVRWSFSILSGVTGRPITAYLRASIHTADIEARKQQRLH